MSFENLLGNESQKKILLNTVREKRIGHSYIFSGIQGIGKMLFALEFSKLINCDKPESRKYGCSCLSCTKIEKNIHPDVTLLDYKEENIIKIDHIRKDLEDRIYLSPFESAYKIFIIDDAERMNFNAQNAFLKTLEEPPKFSVIILVSSSINFITPTIRSRCRIIHFHPLSENIIAKKLAETGSLDKKAVTIVSKLANGSLGKALGTNNEYLNFRRDILKKLMEVKYDRPSKIFELYDFMNVESMDNGLERRKQLFDLISLWLRELLLVKLNYDREHIVNSDMFEEFSNYVKDKSIDSLLIKADQLEDSWYGLSRLNSNKKLVFEDLFLKLSA